MNIILSDNANIAIAGGGLLGRLLAWRLLESGHQVTLYDAGSFDDSPSAAHTAAGMISPISEAIDTEPLMYDLGVASLALWPNWLQELSVNASPIPYAHNGSLIVAHHRDLGLLQQYAQDMRKQVPDVAQGEWLDKQGISALESDLSEHFQQGLFLAEEAHIDNRQLLRVLLQRIQALGGQCFEGTAVDVEPCRVHLLENKSTVSFDLVMDCRGVGSKPQWQGVRGVRGEVLRVQTDEVSLQRPVRLLHPRYQLYIVPKANQEFVIGATQIESEDRSPISVQSALELNSALYTLNPAFAEARIIEMQSNLRPALNDNRPQIQHQDGLIKVNGLYRHGYLLAPVVVQHTLALIDASVLLPNDFSGVLYQSASPLSPMDNRESQGNVSQEKSSQENVSC
jgi:glycine oxidase